MEQILPGQIERAQHLRLLEKLSRTLVAESTVLDTKKIRKELVLCGSVPVSVVHVCHAKWMPSPSKNSPLLGCWIATTTLGRYDSTALSKNGCILMPYVLEDLETIPSLQDLCLQHVSVDASDLDEVWVFTGDPFMEKDYFRIVFQSLNGQLRLATYKTHVTFFDASEFSTWKEAFIGASRAITEYAETHHKTSMTILLFPGEDAIPYQAFFQRMKM
jgi:hypothetical protein